jgi:EpsI family protein
MAENRQATAVGGSAVPAASHAHVNICLLVVVSAALVFAYREALVAMVRLWNNSPMYSYGFTVPLVSAYLLWTRRSALAALAPRPSWKLGSLLLATALLLTVAGRAGGILVVEQLAFLVSLAAAVFLLFGASYARVGWAALAYLTLMVPLWDGLTESLHEPFQHRSAAIGTWLLHLLGIPAFHEGTFITLPNLQIEVARVCSGVNYLVAVVALGLPLGYVFLRDNWRRALLLTAAVGVAATSNGLRVALICALAYYEVGSPLHGPFHILHGLFVAGIGYVVLFAGLRVLAPKTANTADHRSAPRGAAGQPAVAFISLRAAVVLVFVFALTGSSVVARQSRPVPDNGSFRAFPVRLGNWVADPASSVRNASAALFPGADAEVSRRYRRSDGAVVDVYLGYYASQHQRKEMVTHRSAELHSGATRRRISGAGGRGFDANYVRPDRNGVERLFWYEVDARPETGRYLVKVRTLWNTVWDGRSNGAVIVLSSSASAASGGDVALDDIAGHVQEAVAARLPRLSAGADRQPRHAE